MMVRETKMTRSAMTSLRYRFSLLLGLCQAIIRLSRRLISVPYQVFQRFIYLFCDCEYVTAADR